MCGRFAQYEPPSHYIEALNPNDNRPCESGNHASLRHIRHAAIKMTGTGCMTREYFDVIIITSDILLKLMYFLFCNVYVHGFCSPVARIPFITKNLDAKRLSEAEPTVCTYNKKRLIYQHI
jgi:hypothetical protein